MTMGQESSSSRHSEDAILAKYYSQLNPRKEPFAEKYELINTVLGEGITGKVYKCKLKRNPNSEIFALKALPKVGKTVREVVLHKRMQNGCKYIVEIKDVFENVVRGREVLFIVMELMEGGELFTAISSRYPHKPFSEREVAQLVLCVCTAVKHLHDNGIAHRDLKPENLLFSSSDPDKAIIKLTDFGFAKESVDSLKTPNFTPYYGAPEVIKSKGTDTHSYDKSCDCWSLGVIIYILLCGYPPFYSRRGMAMSPGMRDHIVKGDFQFPPREWNRVSKEAKDLVQRLLVVDPKKRATIDNIVSDHWIKSHRQLPELPLGSADVLASERPNWEEMRQGMSQQLESMRNDAKVTLKPVGRNELFKKRVQKGEGLGPIQDAQSSVEGASSHPTSPVAVPSAAADVSDQHQQGMSQQLESMRNDAKVTLKPVGRNELFKKRVQKGEGLGPIQDAQSSVEGASSHPTSPVAVPSAAADVSDQHQNLTKARVESAVCSIS
ncbi:MAP kinase-activated protein kinase 2-like isoform X2 [Convolutriloba macropyga]|uniref:MAP kinase-activated protein kinase 2-like isoform X2 n=1 Tax=Convolutriloba macropyga TaxID=536237 RepID=UPI003F5217FD